MPACSRHIEFNRYQWKNLHLNDALALSLADLDALSGAGSRLTHPEIQEIYEPLVHWIKLAIEARNARFSVRQRYLNQTEIQTPFVLGICGSVAAGKSTTARVIQKLLGSLGYQTTILPTDGFLHANQILENQGIMNRKGFPESYNLQLLMETLQNVRANKFPLRIPSYDHRIYDIVPEGSDDIQRTDVIILEGLNLLQTKIEKTHPHRVFVSDFLDFSIYVDAEPEDLKAWYLSRFLGFRDLAKDDPTAFFYHFAQMDEETAVARAMAIWENINHKNLVDNILPYKNRADLILKKKTTTKWISSRCGAKNRHSRHFLFIII